MRKIIYLVALIGVVLALVATPVVAQPSEGSQGKSKSEEGKAKSQEKKAEAKENKDEGKAKAEEKKGQPKGSKSQGETKSDEGKAKAEANKAEAREHRNDAADKAKGPKDKAGKDKGPKDKDGKGKDGDVVPGNNGTIKIDGEPLDGSNGNEPHVGCVFALNFFNFDEATKTSTVTFEGQAPSGGGVFLSDSVTFSGGEASATYSLSDFDAAALAEATPHPQQGYHVKVTTSTPYSNGADVKHKVFWINCPPPVAVLPPDDLGAAAAGDTSSPDEAEMAPEVLGSRITREDDTRARVIAAQRSPEVFGIALPFTGGRNTALFLGGFVLIAVGTMLLFRKSA